MLALGTYTGWLNDRAYSKSVSLTRKNNKCWSTSGASPLAKLHVRGDLSCVQETPVSVGDFKENNVHLSKEQVQCSEGGLRTPKFKQSCVFTNLIEAKSYHSCNRMQCSPSNLWYNVGSLAKNSAVRELKRGSKNCYWTQMKNLS